MSINCVRLLLENAALSHPDKIALIHQEQQLSYSELLTRVNQVAFYLHELDLPKGARVGIYANKNVSQVLSLIHI